MLGLALNFYRKKNQQATQSVVACSCSHNSSSEDGYMTCLKCGSISRPDLDTSVQKFNAITHYDKRVSRVDRFMRLCKNVCGYQSIPDHIYEACKPYKNDLGKLKSFIKQNHKAYLNKLPSIWRGLGNNYNGLSPGELEQLRYMFVAQDTFSSFLIMVPYLLEQINRPDLMIFVKYPSAFIQKKYNKRIKWSRMELAKKSGMELLTAPEGG